MKHHPLRIERFRGFTLLEALIALVVFAVGLVALTQFHAAALLNSADAKARSQATTLAHAKINELITAHHPQAFKELQSLPAASAETNATSGTDLYGMDLIEGFSRHWVVEGEYIADYDCNGTETTCLPPPCSCNPGASPCTDAATTDQCHQKRIEVTVDWTDARNVKQEIHLESIIEQPDYLVRSGQALSTTTPPLPTPSP